MGWSDARVAAYHKRMQALYDERYGYLDAPAGDPDSDVDPGPYMDEPPGDTDSPEFRSECVEFGCHLYDPDEWEQHRGPYWNEAHRDWD
jgi:hypothetical protein